MKALFAPAALIAGETPAVPVKTLSNNSTDLASTLAATVAISPSIL
jgi:hypothetical protein